MRCVERGVKQTRVSSTCYPAVTHRHLPSPSCAFRGDDITPTRSRVAIRRCTSVSHTRLRDILGGPKKNKVRPVLNSCIFSISFHFSFSAVRYVSLLLVPAFLWLHFRHNFIIFLCKPDLVFF